MPSKKKSGKKGAMIGMGLALATAGAYLLYKKAPARTKKQLHALVSKAKKQAVREYGKLKDTSEAGYDKAVALVMREYRGLKNIDAKELSVLGRELKSQWKRVKKSVAAGRAKKR